MADSGVDSIESSKANANKRDFRKRKFRTKNQFGKRKRGKGRGSSSNAISAVDRAKSATEFVDAGSVDESVPGVDASSLPSTSASTGGKISTIFSGLIETALELDNNEDFESVTEEFLVEVEEIVSATKKRLDGFKKRDNLVNPPAADEQLGLDMGRDSDNCCFTQLQALSDLVKVAKCGECGRNSLVIKENAEKRKGLASVLSMNCLNEACPTFHGPQCSVYTSRKSVPPDYARNPNASFTTGRHGKSGSSRLPFAINLRLVLASRAIGIGYFQLRRFFSILGIADFMHLKTFQSLNNKLHEASQSAVKQNLSAVRQMVKELYQTEEFMQDNANQDLMNKNKFQKPLKPGDIGAMFDGTWQKRGKGQSHNGICNAIDINTGYLIDYQVYSNFCQVCLQAPDEDSPEYEAWMDDHAAKCKKNTNVSAHNMEATGAVQIWSRSEEKEPPLRYRSFLSDGDSAAYLAVKKERPYGDDDVVKEDCANHVAKRLGTALRKVKGLPRGHALKDETIKKLSLYYRIAVSQNKGDVQKMYEAIWASYLHSASTDDGHMHKFCPAGEDSWCKFNAAIAKGEEPPPHKPRLTKIQAQAIKDIYTKLTDQELLSRCRQGKTQNPCESLNGRIWMLCPKTRYASLRSVETAAAIAILWYNKGYTAFSDVLDELGVGASDALKKETEKADNERIRQMQKKLTAEQRHKRQKRSLELAREADERKKREGVTYHSGGLDLGMFDHVVNSDSSSSDEE